MKYNLWIWIMAVVIAIVIPSMIFSIAEKRHMNKCTSKTSEPTSLTEANNCMNTVSSEDFIWVLQEGGEAQKMDMHTYLTGVLLGEIPTNFEEETLKAQAIVARTYAKKRSQMGSKHSQGAVCTESACCQAYCDPVIYVQKGGKQETVEKYKKAVTDTAGMVLTYQNELIEATYFSCSGGRTEDAIAVWGTDFPYLQAVDSPGEENATHYTDQIKMTAAEFVAKLGVSLQGSPSSWFGKVTYTSGGGVDTMVIGGTTFRGVELRQKLNLYSTAFSVMPAGDYVHIYTRGFGHRVGMSQYGADAMAAGGSTFREILVHYYPGTELKTDLN